MYALLWIKCCAKDSIRIINVHEIVSIEYCANNTSIAIVAWRNLAILSTKFCLNHTTQLNQVTWL